MKPIYVIKNVPAKLPFQSTILYSFLLWYFKVDNLWWGIFICIYFIYWLIVGYIVFHQKQIDITSPPSIDDDHDVFEAKISFAKKLQDIVDKNKNGKTQ